MGISHSPSIVTNGLVLCLDAGNLRSYPGSGTTWTDLSGNGLNATLTNGPTFSNNSLVFDGVNDHAVISHNELLNPASITVSTWVNPTALTNPSNTAMNIVSKDFNIGYRYRFSSLNNPTGNITFFDRGGTNAITFVNANNGSPVAAGRWHFITVTGSASGLKTYLNGSLVVSNSTAFGGNTSTGTLVIGAGDAGGTESFYGNIATVNLYNRELSAEEVTQNFNALRGRFGL